MSHPLDHPLGNFPQQPQSHPLGAPMQQQHHHHQQHQQHQHQQRMQQPSFVSYPLGNQPQQQGFLARSTMSPQIQQQQQQQHQQRTQQPSFVPHPLVNQPQQQGFLARSTMSSQIQQQPQPQPQMRQQQQQYHQPQMNRQNQMYQLSQPQMQQQSYQQSQPQMQQQQNSRSWSQQSQVQQPQPQMQQIQPQMQQPQPQIQSQTQQKMQQAQSQMQQHAQQQAQSQIKQQVQQVKSQAQQRFQTPQKQQPPHMQAQQQQLPHMQAQQQQQSMQQQQQSMQQQQHQMPPQQKPVLQQQDPQMLSQQQQQLMQQPVQQQQAPQMQQHQPMSPQQHPMQQQQAPQMQQQQMQQQAPQMQEQQPMQQQQTIDLQPPMNGPDGVPTSEPNARGDVPNADESPTTVKGGIKKLKSMFKSSKEQGPNLGFVPTPAMAQKHEDAHVSGKRPLYQFQVTKLRSWRTGYVRLLCLYDDHFSTFDPDHHQVTNTWKYSALREYLAVESDQLLLQVGDDKLKFQCHMVPRSAVLSALLQCKFEFEESQTQQQQLTKPPSIVLCLRATRHGTQTPSGLRLTPFGLIEIHPTTRRELRMYKFTDTFAISFASDDPRGIFLHMTAGKKVRLFLLNNTSGDSRSLANRSNLVTWMREAYDRIGLDLRMTDSLSTEQWLAQRRQLGTQVGSIATEWEVSKTSPRHDSSIVGNSSGWAGGLVTRRLAITGQGYIIEQDAAGVVSCRSLAGLYGIVRHAQSDKITLEFSDGSSRTYTSKSRDSLLVSLFDAATTLGKNTKVHISDVSSRGYCLAIGSTSAAPGAAATDKSSGGGLFQPISIPQYCLKRVYTVSTGAFAYLSTTNESSIEEGAVANPTEECRVVVEACHELNASVLPSAEGLPSSEKDKNIIGSVGALWGLVTEMLEEHTSAKGQKSSRKRYEAEQAAATMLQTLHRLCKTPAGYKGCVDLATMTNCLPLLLAIEDDFSKFWALRVLTVLVSGLPGSKRNREIEYVNKSVIFKAGGLPLINGLVATLLAAEPQSGGPTPEVSDLILMVTSDLLQSVLCSYHDTTSPDHFLAFIQSLADRYRSLLGILKCQTPFVVENSALLLHLLTTHAPTVASSIREAALSSAILLHHFHASVFSPLEGQRFLSRFLCSLWLSGPDSCDEKKLLKRMVPRGFIGYLKMPQLSRAEEDQLDELERDAVEENISEPNEGDGEEAFDISKAINPTGGAGTNTARLRSRIALARASAAKSGNASDKPENFRIFFHVMTENHALADLIWNQQTRRELRIGLESEIQYIGRERDARGIDQIAWNHQQFSITYPSLDGELRVGSIYMRLWLQAGDGFIRTWDEPLRLFELLFRRFLCEIDRDSNVTIMCIRCMERLYAIHGPTIGPFPDVMIIVRSMASTRSVETQHRLLKLLSTILGVVDKEGKSAVDIPENAEQLLNLESIEQLCQFVAWGHTNGVQVGNLMTAVLGSSYAHSGLAMLTNGPSTGSALPSDGTSGNESSKTASPDATCPPVWFVASSNRIPPPPESVTGPFRVSELRQMMERGEISPFSLITSTNVEYYDDEEADEGKREVEVDTGSWKRLENIWQLRWQLCTDGNDSGIYSPSDVSLMAIQSLKRLVDLHRSLDSRGVPYYPIPIAKRILCGLSRDPTVSNTESDAGTRAMHQSSFLSVIAQSLLCNDPRVVDRAAELLYSLTRYNEEATSKFYLTGAFMFICCYAGSNFKAVAKLIHATHMDQHFLSGFAAAADEGELPAKERSVLGNMLPDGLLFILINYGVERFSEIFVGNHDTPEVIWNFEMRKHLIEMVAQHLGDFPRRLWQHTTTHYEYCPIPGIAYKRLEKEIFCHNYYLNNLCDEQRFPNWPIAEPVEVFRSCLEEFKKQMNRDEAKEEHALEDACKVLKLNADDGSKELRRAYRSLARKYHPDKNPAGREQFELIRTSYELLLPYIESGQSVKELIGAESGAISGDDDDGDNAVGNKSPSSSVSEGFPGGLIQMNTIQLLVKAQSMVYKRFESDMGKYKYPAYQLIMSCLKRPPSCQKIDVSGNPPSLLQSCLMSEDRANFVRNAAELAFRTCLVSPLNAEELIEESGVAVLEDLLDFYIHALRQLVVQKSSARIGTASESTVSEIIQFIVHTLAGTAFYETGRTAIESLSDLNRFLVNWRRCVDGVYFGNWLNKVGGSLIKKHALEGIASMSRSKKLQDSLIGSGIVWPLGMLLLEYDPTLDESQQSQEDDVGISQAACNTNARLSARALGMLCGALRDESLQTPENQLLTSSMQKLLTESISILLRNKRTGDLLRTLNTNVETPSRIWNIRMRAELLQFLSKTFEERPENEVRSVEDELKSTSMFGFSNLDNELQIGGVYVRVFNAVGDDDRSSTAGVQNPVAFSREVIQFIASSLNQCDELAEGWVKLPDAIFSCPTESCVPSCKSTNDHEFVMSINALRILVRIDGLIDDVLCDETANVSSVLLSLLELPQDSKAFEIGCDILSIMSPKQQFADSVATQGSLWRLLWMLERASHGTADGADMLRKERGWQLLESFSSSPSIAADLIKSTAWLELLGVLIGYNKFTKAWVARKGAAKALSRMLWDPKTGPQFAPQLQRLLPLTLTVVLKEEGPEKMLVLFDGDNDTPELIWDESMRIELRDVVAEQLDKCIEVRSAGGDGYALPPLLSVKYKKLEDELFVGGVYVSRYLKEPAYNLRDSSTFLEMLLKRWAFEMTQILSGDSAAPAEESKSKSIVIAGQDALQLVTNACVYLCKIRGTLCDKLSQWGYISQSLTFLQDSLDRKLTGSPLLSVVRLIHVASGRRINVESLVTSSQNSVSHGIVSFTISAIGSDSLHADAAFMVEMLKKIYEEALGDLKNAEPPQLASQKSTTNVSAPSGNQSYPSDNPQASSQPQLQSQVPLNFGNQSSIQQPQQQIAGSTPAQYQQHTGVGLAPYGTLQPNGMANLNDPLSGHMVQPQQMGSQYQQQQQMGRQQPQQPQQPNILSNSQNDRAYGYPSQYQQQAQNFPTQVQSPHQGFMQQSSYVGAPNNQQQQQQFGMQQQFQQQQQQQQQQPMMMQNNFVPNTISTPGQENISGTSGGTMNGQPTSFQQVSQNIGGGYQPVSQYVGNHMLDQQMSGSNNSQGAIGGVETIIDARSAPDPSAEAESRAANTMGAPGCADGRIALLQSAVECQLVQFLVDSVLENATLRNVKDPAAAKVHSVELVKMLASDPGYGGKFELILGKLPAWKKYKSQDHSLFITGPEQKADYFLTDGKDEPTKLLTES